MDHLPELDLSIDDVGHVYPPQIRQDDPVPERRDSKGVFMLDGVMVDRPGIVAAEQVVAWADSHGR